MQSSSQGRYTYQRYQGYPYVNPVVIDAPTIDAATASKWSNLPRRPVQLPGPSGVVPGASNAGNSPQTTPPENDPVPPKQDIDENPVVYIDIPEAGSEVSQSIEPPEEEEPEYVQETIMYDPFDNRRIDMPKEDAISHASSESDTTSGVHPSHSRPVRPDTLNLAGASSSTSPGTSRPAPSLPDFLSKESQVYGGQGSDGFPLSPIPISEFPEPPPAYTEVAMTPVTNVSNVPTTVGTPEHVQPPRTQVIVPESTSPGIPSTPIGVQNFDRKYVICHQCGMRVHTLVVRETGPMTHLIACIVLLIFLPLIIVVYWCDTFKYKNHYCPNCNNQIGYEVPLVGKKMNYVV